MSDRCQSRMLKISAMLAALLAAGSASAEPLKIRMGWLLVPAEITLAGTRQVLLFKRHRTGMRLSTGF